MKKLQILSQILFYYRVNVQPTTDCSICCAFIWHGMHNSPRALESKLNHLVRIICGLKKRDSIRAVRERNHFPTVKKFQLKENLKLLVIVLRNESPFEEIKSIITCVDFNKVSESRSTCRSIRPSDNANGCSSQSIRFV